MIGTILGASNRLPVGKYYGIELGSLEGSIDGTADGIFESLLLVT